MGGGYSNSTPNSSLLNRSHPCIDSPGSTACVTSTSAPYISLVAGGFLVTVGAQVADTAGVGVRVTLGVHVTLDVGVMVNIGKDVVVAVLMSVAESLQADSSIARAIRRICDLLFMTCFLLPVVVM